MQQDPYQVLGVSREATDEEIKTEMCIRDSLYAGRAAGNKIKGKNGGRFRAEPPVLKRVQAKSACI